MQFPCVFWEIKNTTIFFASERTTDLCDDTLGSSQVSSVQELVVIFGVLFMEQSSKM